MLNRLKNKSIVDGLVAMAEGNPGAATVLMELLGGKNPTEDSFSLGLLDVRCLDIMEIYGSNLWVCYKDLCGQDVEKLRSYIRDGSIKERLQKSNRGTL